MDSVTCQSSHQVAPRVERFAHLTVGTVQRRHEQDRTRYGLAFVLVNMTRCHENQDRSLARAADMVMVHHVMLAKLRAQL
jgi:hypothetical protein